MTDELKGIVVRLLAFTEQHGTLSRDELTAYLKKEFDDSPLAEGAIKESLETNLLVSTDSQIRVTEEGRAFIDSEAKALSVEEEAPDAEGSEPYADDSLLQKTAYDVAKLKVESRPVTVFQALRKIEKDEIRL